MASDDFEWDDAKAAENYAKHGIGFETASRVFDDAFAIEGRMTASPTGRIVTAFWGWSTADFCT